MRWLRLGGTATDASPWTMQVLGDGLRYARADQTGRISAGIVEPLLVQWADAGCAVQESASWLVPYDGLFRIMEDPAYTEVCKDVQVPPLRSLAPRLVSHGSLSDTHFSIAIEGWIDEHGMALNGLTAVIGAVATVGGENCLLPRSSWALLDRIRAFTTRSDAERDERSHRIMWGEIRRLALEARARLDEFLHRTIVLTPERIRIGLRRSDLQGDKIIEVMPDFDGAPENWLHVFDSNESVRDRYDLPTADGIVQVMVAPDVRTVLEQIKRMTGRRVSGARAEAFITNPFAALGESASHVIDAAEFEGERVRAGLTFDRFTVYVDSTQGVQARSFGLLVESGQGSGAQSVRVPLSKDTAREFIAIMRSALAQGRQLCTWDEYEFELLGDTENQLQRLELLLAPDRVLPEVIYDLTFYSDRISGIGEERPYASPYIARREEGQGWFPENLVTLLELPPAETGGDPRYVEVTAEQLSTLEEDARVAKSEGQASIRIPGTQDSIPVDSVDQIIRSFSHAKSDAGNGTLDEIVAGAKNRKLRKGLVVKPNIDNVDYGQDRGVLTVLPAVAPLPKALKPNIQLKQHQVDGFNWMRHLFAYSPERCGGAVLADDMGLGKTLQLLTLILWAHESDPDLRPALIVAPVALLENWRDEARKFLAEGALPILEAYGDALAKLRVPKEDVSEQLKQDGLVRFLTPGWVGQAKVVLTTYETLRDLEFSFAAEKWSIFVCDEAQKIKNPNALVTRAAKKQNARFKVACTGTPVENSLADLWCLFDFVQPGLLGALNEFGRRYRRPIEAKTDDERARVEELRAQINPQILRRLKADVAQDLPRKIDNHECKSLRLSNPQRTLYSHAVGQYGKRADLNTSTPFQNALGLLHYLRLVCTDPQPYGLTNFRRERLDDYRRKAPKLDWLLKTLTAIQARGEKVLIFCEFKDIQRLLQHYIAEELGYSADIINGETSASSSNDQSRQKRIRAFQERPGFGAIILSPLAVGFGVNIQAANHVVHYTRSWNPAKEDQATDRAYRIGQTRDVHVYCPVVTAPDFITFEAKLDELLARKRALAGDMLNGTGDVGADEFEIGGVAPPGSNASTSGFLALDDVLRMLPRHFEAYTAVLWSRQGYAQVVLTPSTGDGGVDVVAIRGNNGELIQCKTARTDGQELGWDAIKDVVTGEAGYIRQYPNVTFGKVCVTTQYFNRGAHEQARNNNVRLIDQTMLEKLMAAHSITLTEVERMLFKRHGTI